MQAISATAQFVLMRYVLIYNEDFFFSRLNVAWEKWLESLTGDTFLFHLGNIFTFFHSTAVTNVYKYTMRWLITVMIQQLDPPRISAEILEGEGEDQA